MALQDAAAQPSPRLKLLVPSRTIYAVIAVTSGSFFSLNTTIFKQIQNICQIAGFRRTSCTESTANSELALDGCSSHQAAGAGGSSGVVSILVAHLCLYC